MTKLLAFLVFATFGTLACAEISKEERKLLDAVATLEQVGDAAGSTDSYVFDTVDEQIRRNLLLSRCPSFASYRGTDRIAKIRYFNAVNGAIVELNKLAASALMPKTALSETGAGWLAAYRLAEKSGDPKLLEYADEAGNLRYKAIVTPAQLADLFENERIDINSGEGRPDSLHRLRKAISDRQITQELLAVAKKHGHEITLAKFMAYTDKTFDPNEYDSHLHSDLDGFFLTHWKVLAVETAVLLDTAEVQKSTSFFESNLAVQYYTSVANTLSKDTNSQLLAIPQGLPDSPVNYTQVLTLLSQRKMSDRLEQQIGPDIPPLSQRLTLQSMVNSIHRNAAQSICQN